MRSGYQEHYRFPDEALAQQAAHALRSVQRPELAAPQAERLADVIMELTEDAACVDAVTRAGALVRVEFTLHDDIDMWAMDGGGPESSVFWAALAGVVTAFKGNPCPDHELPGGLTFVDDDEGLAQDAARLVALLADEDRSFEAEEALVELGAAAVDPLVAALGSAELRPSASMILEEIGDPAIPALVRALSDSALGEHAGFTLGSMGGAVLAPLREQVRTGSPDVVLTAVEVLENLDVPPGLEDLEVLVDRLVANPEVRVVFLSDVLWKGIQALGDPARKLAERLLREGGELHRFEAAEALEPD